MQIEERIILFIAYKFSDYIIVTIISLSHEKRQDQVPSDNHRDHKVSECDAPPSELQEKQRGVGTEPN